MSSPDRIRSTDGGRWIQLNVGLVRHGGKALSSARELFDRLIPLIGFWRKRSLLRWFFFMRKPPDVRLRFFMLESGDPISELSVQMKALQSENCIREWFFSEYIPETGRFGGPHAMELVHEHFDTDTSVWWGLDRLQRQGENLLGTETRLLATVQDLFLRAAASPADTLNTWRRLERLTPLSERVALPRIPLRIRKEGLAGLEVSEPERIWIDCHAKSNAALANGLAGLGKAGQLTRDLEEILAAVALFTFHRHGIPGTRSSLSVAAMIRDLTVPQQKGGRRW